MDYKHLKTCEGITEDDFRLAITSKEQIEAFLKHIGDISKPGTGVGKVLFFFARLAIRNKESAGTANYVYEDLALQVTPSRRNPTLFEIRYMNDVGGSFELIFKVTVWCTFPELLEAVRDVKNITPFTCEDGRENYLLLRATADRIKTSIPPPAYGEADARYQELFEAGMSPLKRRGRPADKPSSSNLPEELSYATVRGVISPVRKKYDSLADEAYDLAQLPPSIPSEPITAEDSVRSRQSEAIARLSLVKVSAGLAGQSPSSKSSLASLRNRPETVRPPGIEEVPDDEIDCGWDNSKKDD